MGNRGGFFDGRMRVGMLPTEAEEAVPQTTIGRSLALSTFASAAGKVFHCWCIRSARRNLPRRLGGAMIYSTKELRQIHQTFLPATRPLYVTHEGLFLFVEPFRTGAYAVKSNIKLHYAAKFCGH